MLEQDGVWEKMPICIRVALFVIKVRADIPFTNGVQKLKHRSLKLKDILTKTDVDYDAQANGFFFERFDDDFCSVAYFYLDKPYSNLPTIDSVEKRTSKYIGIAGK